MFSNLHKKGTFLQDSQQSQETVGLFVRCVGRLVPRTRVQSDKYPTGIITIVPIRTAMVKIEKYR